MRSRGPARRKDEKRGDRVAGGPLLPGCCPGEPAASGGGWRRTWGGGDRAGPGRFGGSQGAAVSRLAPPAGQVIAAERCPARPGPALPGGLRGLFVLAAGSSPGCPGSPNSNQTRCGRSRPAGGSAPLRCGAGGAAREPPAGAREPLGAPGNGAGGRGGDAHVHPPAWCGKGRALSLGELSHVALCGSAMAGELFPAFRGHG